MHVIGQKVTIKSRVNGYVSSIRYKVIAIRNNGDEVDIQRIRKPNDIRTFVNNNGKWEQGYFLKGDM